MQHGKRADSIVKNMLLHSREGSGEIAEVNINAMVEEALNLAYHGARAERPGFNVTIRRSLDPEAGAAQMFAQDMTRVLLNLISNGFYATNKRKRQEATAATSRRWLLRHKAMAIESKSASATMEPAFPPRRRRKYSIRSSPPSRRARAPASACR